MNSPLTLLLLFVVLASSHAFSPKGSAAKPLDKKKVAVIGGGGYLGANTLGFLQRAGSIFDTGIDRNFRCIGATKETQAALNSLLSRHFVLAQADETFVKLTDMESVEAIAKSLEGHDAIILGNSMVVEKRPVTMGTFGKGPNDKTFEIFWDTVRGKEMFENPEMDPQLKQIIDNTLEACKVAGVQKIVAVATAGNNYDSFCESFQTCGIPFALIQCPGALTNTQSFSYIKGIQGNVELSSEGSGQGMCREDLAALSVACLTSLDWAESQTLSAESSGPLVMSQAPTKRPDQDWCVNSDVLAAKLCEAF